MLRCLLLRWQHHSGSGVGIYAGCQEHEKLGFGIKLKVKASGSGSRAAFGREGLSVDLSFFSKSVWL
jgi:hypothetical protein